MVTMQAKRFKEGLQKVRKVGRLEEQVTISGCEVVIQNMSLEEYTAALHECEGLEALDYANVFQIAQVCRSIIEIDGQDMRDVDLIEDEVPAGHFVVELSVPNKAAADTVVEALQKLKLQPTVTQVENGATKTIRFERHHWLRENIIRHWGREAVSVAWRKVTEMFIQADAKAKEGVQFTIADETPEDKLRRCLNELSEIESELPNDLITKILDEMGLVRKSTQQELDTVNARMQQVAQPAPQAPAPQPVPQAQVAPPRAAPLPEAVPMAPQDPASFVPPEAVRRAMAERSRLNTEGGSVPIPAPPPEAIPVSAAPRAKIADDLRQQAIEATQRLQGARNEPEGLVTRRGGRTRAEEIAALEGMSLPEAAPPLPTRQPREVDLGEAVPIQGSATNPTELVAITDRPPPVGRNVKFNPRF